MKRINEDYVQAKSLILFSEGKSSTLQRPKQKTKKKLTL